MMLTWGNVAMRRCRHELMLTRDDVDTRWCWHDKMMLILDDVDKRRCCHETMLPRVYVNINSWQHCLMSTSSHVNITDPVSTSTRVNIVSFHADTRWCWQYSMLTWGGADTRQQLITTLHFILFDVAVRDLMSTWDDADVKLDFDIFMHMHETCCWPGFEIQCLIVLLAQYVALWISAVAMYCNIALHIKLCVRMVTDDWLETNNILLLDIWGLHASTYVNLLWVAYNTAVTCMQPCMLY